MKQNIILNACLFLFLVLFVLPGCEKVNEEEKPTEIGSLEATISDYNPPYGGTSTVTWEISNPSIYERIIVKNNNEVLSTLSKGSETLDSITQIQRISISCFKKGEIEPSLENKLDDIIPQDLIVENKLPSLTMLTADPPFLPIGGGITTISWTSNESTLSVEYNEVSYPANGSLSVYVVNDSTILTFIAKGNEGQRASTILIRVEQAPPPPPPLTVEDTLCMGGWWRAKLEFQSGPNAPWIEHSMSEHSMDDVMTFYLIPVKKSVVDFGQLRPEGVPPSAECAWSLSGNILTVCEASLYEISVNQDTLIMVSGSIEKVRETFVH